MGEPIEQSLHERLAALEAQVAGLQDQVQRLRSQAPVRPPAEAPPRPVVPPPLPSSEKKTARPPKQPPKGASKERAKKVQSALKSEDLLNKIGIALLLFGLAFFDPSMAAGVARLALEAARFATMDAPDLVDWPILGLSARTR